MLGAESTQTRATATKNRLHSAHVEALLHQPGDVLVEQNAKVALETVHYGYVLEIGRVVMNDTCERLMNSPDIQEFYLGAREAGARGERRRKKKKTWR
jgi:ABC-type lipopolysaccharide export system ATPase subunit